MFNNVAILKLYSGHTLRIFQVKPLERSGFNQEDAKVVGLRQSFFSRVMRDLDKLLLTPGHNAEKIDNCDDI